MTGPSTGTALKRLARGVSTIKSFVSEKEEIERLGDAADILLDSAIDVEKANARFSSNMVFAATMGAGRSHRGAGAEQGGD